MKLERLIGILAILLQREKVTAPAWRNCLRSPPAPSGGMWRPCARRASLWSPPRGAGGGISILEGYRVDRTLLTAPEMQAILAGLRSLDSVSGTRRYAQLMEKLSAGSGTLVPGGAHLLIDLSSWAKTSLPPKIEVIQTALEDHRTLSFTYFAPNGTSQREVEPYYLLFHWSAWYVWGWCLTRQDFRLFKLGRMTDLATGEPFVPRPAPRPDLRAERIFPPRYPVTVVFQPEHQWRLVEEYGADSLRSSRTVRCALKAFSRMKPVRSAGF